MKKSVVKVISMVFAIILILMLGANYALRINVIHGKLERSSEEMFQQAEWMIEKNKMDIEEVENEFAESCLRYARMIAHIVSRAPEVIEDLEEMRRLAELMGVDEIHFFDREGEIYAGTNPEYYGFNFHSGEQMEFFLPLLEDTSLELCQEITPNTAEGRRMQYAAVWAEDKSQIVQIGMEPKRVLDAMAGRTLDAVSSFIVGGKSTVLYIIDKETGKVVACNKEAYVGKTVADLGMSAGEIPEELMVFHGKIDGERSCIFARSSGDYILMRSYVTAETFQEAVLDTILLGAYIFLVGLLTIFLVLSFMDKKIVRELDRTNEMLQEIEQGHSDSLLSQSAVPELQELREHINGMLKTVLDPFEKVSMALERSYTPIGICEYSKEYNRGFMTSRVKEILMLDEEEERQLQQDFRFVFKKIQEIKKNPLKEKNVYALGTKPERYIQMEEFDSGSSYVVLFVDVTLEWNKKEMIKRQRDIDILTNLYSRRAFYTRMTELFEHREQVGYGVLLMMDVDGLKRVNDQYGHAAGDLYISQAGKTILSYAGAQGIGGRLGGDEFVLFLYGFRKKEDLLDRLERFKEENGRSIIEVEDGRRFPVWFSIGYAYYPEDSEDYHVLLRLADEAMYRDKKKRKEADSWLR